MKKSILIVFLFFVSCKKVDKIVDDFNEANKTIPNCTHCSSIKTLEGNYRGFASGVSLFNSYDDSDSVDVKVVQYFEGNNQYDDSTKMRIKLIITLSDNSVDSLIYSMPQGTGIGSYYKSSLTGMINFYDENTFFEQDSMHVFTQMTHKYSSSKMDLLKLDAKRKN